MTTALPEPHRHRSVSYPVLAADLVAQIAALQATIVGAGNAN